MNDNISDVGQLENTDKLLSNVKAERESLSFSFKDTKKQLEDFKSDFPSESVERKALVKKVIKQYTKNLSLHGEVLGLHKTLEVRPVVQDKTTQWRGSQTLSMSECYTLALRRRFSDLSRPAAHVRRGS